MTIPRFDRHLPSPVRFISSRRGSRAILIGFLLSALCLSRPAAVLGAAGPSPADNRHDQPYALIFGTVWGQDDRPLYGVKIKIRREGKKKAKWELYSDHRGEFALRVPAGKATYLVWADVKGYKLPDGNKLQPSEEVRVEIANDERTDIGLHLKW